LLTAAAWTAMTACAVADQPPPGPGPTTTVDEVVVTGMPFGVTQRATTIATDVVSQEALATAPAASLGDLLSGRPGLRSTEFSPGANRPVIRGLSGPRVQVLANGIGQIDASSVSPDHAVASDPAEASRIEVIRGPATLVYGGSAIGGVVNVIDDRIPTELPDGGYDGVVSTQASSVDAGRSAFGHLTVGQGHFAINLDAIRRTSDDYEIPSPSLSQIKAEADGVARDDNSKQPNSYTDLKAWGGGASLIGERGFLGASYKETDSEYGTVAEEDVFIKLNQKREDVRGEYRFEDGPFATIRGAYGHAAYTHTEFEGPQQPGTVFNSDGQEGRLDLIMRKRGDWSSSYGVQGLKRDFQAIGDEAFVPSTVIEEAGLYTVQRYDTGNLGLEGGLRFDRRTLRAVPLGQSVEVERQFDNVSGSIALFGRPAPGLFAGLSLSRTQRAPSEVELFADGPHIATAAYERGGIALDNEISTTLEATLHYDRGRFSGEIHAYKATYDGFIDEVQTGEVIDDLPVFQFVQSGADFHGFEAEASYDVWESGDRKVSLEGSADYVKATTDHGPAARIPPFSLTGRAAYASKRFDISAELRHVGKQDQLAIYELPTDSYTLLNVSAAVRPFADRGVTLFAEGRNLTDQEAREHASFLKDIAPMPGRNIRVGVAYRF
jgi:iron complex outermembrane receptor protein